MGKSDNPRFTPDIGKNTQISATNQPANRGRNALEFEIRKALLDKDRPRIAEIVEKLVQKALGYEEANGVLRIDYEAIKFLFEHGFSKPKSDVDINDGQGLVIQIVSGIGKSMNDVSKPLTPNTDVGSTEHKP